MLLAERALHCSDAAKGFDDLVGGGRFEVRHGTVLYTHPLRLSKFLVQFLYTRSADNAPIMSRSENALKLKAIRERAVGLRELARLIGWDASRYQYYEDSYKKPHMPLELIDLIRPHLVGRGTPPVSDAELDSLLPPARVVATINDRDASKPFELVGDRIRTTREARGISVTDLAQLVKLKPALLARAERDDFRPNDDMLRKIARTLGLDGEDLVDRARRQAEIANLLTDPRSRPIAEAIMLRTARGAPPEKGAPQPDLNAQGRPKPKP